MALSVFLKGLVAGLVVCAPVGPIGLLCMRRTLLDGPVVGLVSLLGASTADGLYCVLAGLGVTYIAALLMHEQTLFTLLGGGVLVVLGLKLFFSRTAPKSQDPSTRGLVDAYVSSFFLMLANPMLMLVFTALFTALGVHGWKGDYLSTVTAVAGVLAGSVLWAPILVLAVSLFRPHFGPEKAVLLNRISGLIIIAFGIGAGVVGLTR